MENHSGDIGAQQPRQRRHRSAISNGNRLFAAEITDGRTKVAMRFADLVDDVVSDLGGHLGGRDQLSTAQLKLIRRACTLSVTAELMEANAISGKDFDLNVYSTTANCLRRIFETLGLQRVSRDITPDLRSYLAGKGLP